MFKRLSLEKCWPQTGLKRKCYFAPNGVAALLNFHLFWCKCKLILLCTFESINLHLKQNLPDTKKFIFGLKLGRMKNTHCAQLSPRSDIAKEYRSYDANNEE